MEVCSFPPPSLFDLHLTERVQTTVSSSPTFVPLRWDRIDPCHLSAIRTSMLKKQSSPIVNLPHAKKRKRMTAPAQPRKAATIDHLQDNLDYLLDEWASIDIVLNSLRSAFTIHPLESASEEHLDEIDRELSIAYDDLMAQVRSLDRSLKRLHSEINVLRQQSNVSPKSKVIPIKHSSA